MTNYTRLPLMRSGLNLAAYRAERQGAPFVFQHGLCADPLQAVSVIPPDEPLCHHLMHCRGHGNSEAGNSTQFSIQTFADDLTAFIDQHVQAPCILGGISMGAAISLRMAIMRPDLVSTLILARPAWFTDAEPENLRPLVEIAQLLAKHDPEKAKKRFLASPTAGIVQQSSPGNLKSLLNMFERTPHDITSQLLSRVAGGGPDISPADIAAIRVPTLIIANGDDYIHPLSIADRLAATIPDATQVVITSKYESDTRHTVEFRNAIAMFLDRLG
jgi:pimeloyl-ACP methyl ester carboxylesterase